MVINEELEIVLRMVYELGSVSIVDLIEGGVTRFRANVLINDGFLIKADSSHFVVGDKSFYEKYKNAREEGTDIFVINADVHKIYDILIEDDKLTSGAMRAVGLDSYHVGRLVEQGILKRDSARGIYHLVDTKQYEAYRKVALCNLSVSSSIQLTDNLDALYAVYELLSKGEKLTKSSLKKVRLKPRDIEKLESDGLIGRCDKDEYVIVDYRNMFIYGNYLRACGQEEKAVECHEACYRLDVNRTLWRDFFNQVLIEDEVSALRKLAFLGMAKGTSYEKDFNFYLYLLQFVQSLPKELREQARKMRSSDVLVDDDANTILNELRRCILANDFKKGLRFISTHYNDDDSMPSEVAVVRRVLRNIERNSTALREDIVYYFEKKRVNLLAERLNEEAKKYSLRGIMAALRILANDIVTMRKTGQPVERTRVAGDGLYASVKSGDYLGAYIKSLELAQKQKVAFKDNQIGILSRWAIQEEAKCGVSFPSMLNEIFSRLDTSREVAEMLIDTYLEIQNLTSHRFMIGTLLEIGDKLGDTTHEELFEALCDIVTGDYECLLLHFCEQVRSARKIGDEEVARMYMNILRERQTVTGQEDIAKLVEGLERETVMKDQTEKSRILELPMK